MIKYYPPSKTQTNQNTTGGDYVLNGVPYVGKYYTTFDGKAYTGTDPILGSNELLEPAAKYKNAPGISGNKLPSALTSAIFNSTPDKRVIQEPGAQVPRAINYAGGPTPYYPYPLQSDYDKGYIIRYFAKKKNDIGYVVEVSPTEYNSMQSGTVPYNISLYMTGNILWKLTGPLNSIRLSQYDSRAGIIETNERLVNDLDKRMLGIKEFIGGDYSKFAKPTVT